MRRTGKNDYLVFQFLKQGQSNIMLYKRNFNSNDELTNRHKEQVYTEKEPAIWTQPKKSPEAHLSYFIKQ